MTKQMENELEMKVNIISSHIALGQLKADMKMMLIDEKYDRMKKTPKRMERR